MTNAPAISVIVPVYNVEQFVGRCVESILSQSFEDYEILLIDDGSTDNSAHACKGFSSQDSRIKYFHKENGGLSSARNYGLQVASGEYVTFIDSDDYIDPEYLSHLYRLIKEHDAEIATCFYSTKSPNGIKPWQPQNEMEHVYDSRTALLQLFRAREIDVCAVCKLYKASLFDGIEFPEGKLSRTLEQPISF